MGQDERTTGTPVGAEAQTEDAAPRDPDEIRRDIEETRRELGDTVAAVAEKADVKAQAHAKVDDAKSQAKAKVDGVKARVTSAAPESGGQAAEQAKTFAQENRTALIVAGAVLAGFLVGRMGR